MSTRDEWLREISDWKLEAADEDTNRYFYGSQVWPQCNQVGNHTLSDGKAQERPPLRSMSEALRVQELLSGVYPLELPIQRTV